MTHQSNPLRLLAGALVACLLASVPGFPPRALACIDQPSETLTLPRLLRHFRDVAVVEVERIDVDRGAIRYKVVEQIQGTTQEPLRQSVKEDEAFRKQLKDLVPGNRAVFFSGDDHKRGVTLIEGVWYISVRSDQDPSWWLLADVRRDYFSCCYQGTVVDLAKALKILLKGEAVVVNSCRPARGKCEVQQVRYTMKEPDRKVVVSTEQKD